MPEEADAEKGLISTSSPIGRAILNKEEGDEINVTTPNGARTFELIKVITIHDDAHSRKSVVEEQGTPVFSYSPERRTALVLCGTGAHGAYHAGVLRALQEAGVKIDLIAGQGIGAASAALRRHRWRLTSVGRRRHLAVDSAVGLLRVEAAAPRRRLDGRRARASSCSFRCSSC